MAAAPLDAEDGELLLEPVDATQKAWNQKPVVWEVARGRHWWISKTPSGATDDMRNSASHKLCDPDGTAGISLRKICKATRHASKILAIAKRPHTKVGCISAARAQAPSSPWDVYVSETPRKNAMLLPSDGYPREQRERFLPRVNTALRTQSKVVIHILLEWQTANCIDQSSMPKSKPWAKDISPTLWRNALS